MTGAEILSYAGSTVTVALAVRVFVRGRRIAKLTRRINELKALTDERS